MVLPALSQTPWQVWRGTPPFLFLYAPPPPLPPNTKSCICPSVPPCQRSSPWSCSFRVVVRAKPVRMPTLLPVSSQFQTFYPLATEHTEPDCQHILTLTPLDTRSSDQSGAPHFCKGVSAEPPNTALCTS